MEKKNYPVPVPVLATTLQYIAIEIENKETLCYVDLNLLKFVNSTSPKQWLRQELSEPFCDAAPTSQPKNDAAPCGSRTLLRCTFKLFMI
jgi:hypothetical protein